MELSEAVTTNQKLDLSIMAKMPGTTDLSNVNQGRLRF